MKAAEQSTAAALPIEKEVVENSESKEILQEIVEDAEAEAQEEEAEEKGEEGEEAASGKELKWRFELTHLHILHEYPVFVHLISKDILFDRLRYFQNEFPPRQPSQFIPDFVLFSSLVGNDFVRPLPNFSIIYGGLDLMFSIYKLSPNMQLVQDGQVRVSAYSTI